MFNGAHIIIMSTDPDADRAFFRDVLNMPNVDVGGGWLIFALPPAEAAFHPSEGSASHELFLMCDDINETIKALNDKGVETKDIQNERWGLLSGFTLPGGGVVSFYQPLHEKPH